ncbi:MAG: hypothetical protein WCB72_24740, partial [Candidatus Sulfotelmatobacter sp.]
MTRFLPLAAQPICCVFQFPRRYEKNRDGVFLLLRHQGNDRSFRFCQIGVPRSVPYCKISRGIYIGYIVRVHGLIDELLQMRIIPILIVANVGRRVKAGSGDCT